MARYIKTVRIKALVSFNGVVAGDESSTELTPQVQGWINAGLVKELTDGPNSIGPRRAEPNDNERVTARVDRSVTASREPSESAGTREVGAPAGLDKG